MNSSPPRIRIVSVPPGEAPLWVREKWIGLELPLSRGYPDVRTAYGIGVLSAPRNSLVAIWWWVLGRFERQTGYIVEADEAVRRLETTAPEAAAWWRETVPRLVAPRRKFIFAPSACAIVTEGS